MFHAETFITLNMENLGPHIWIKPDANNPGQQLDTREWEEVPHRGYVTRDMSLCFVTSVSS